MSERDMDTLDAAALFACLTDREQESLLEVMRALVSEHKKEEEVA